MAGSEDVFDAIVMADERFHGQGYREGFEDGSSLGVREGRRHGAAQGARIGAEIGCYRGFALAWRHLLRGCAAEDSVGAPVGVGQAAGMVDRRGSVPRGRKRRVLESLIGLLQQFPYDDPAYERLQEDLDRIRGKFRQLCSLLSVQPDFKVPGEGSGLSF
ncbi:protein LTO1 homolog isoform X2 [Oryctolagus cuniculus]|uniref:protein LTO1 homolog isoform X2 n=1 Tax=Oryctolagus cuniculus TaxID=9986 RepID=UPI0038792B6B